MYDNEPIGARVTQGPTHNTYYYFGGRLGGRKIGDVSNPGNKVLLHDEFDRHFNPRQPYFITPNCRQPLLTFDGGVRVRFTRDCNKGGDPNQPTVMTSYVNVVYNNTNSGPWDPNPQNTAGDVGPGYYRFTRGGLRGIDFGGTEVRKNPHRSPSES
jgi:hypothetical protein